MKKNPNRIAVIGCAGSGKTTLSLFLHKKLGLPVHHLDQYYWLPNWQHPDKQAYVKKHDQLISQDKWIIDGNHMLTMPQRLKRAQAIIFLDLPTQTLVYRIIKRWICNRFTRRQDLPNGCKEQLNAKFIRYVLSFNQNVRPRIIDLIKKEESTKNVFVLSSQYHIDNFKKQR
jgi:adenylate kinase family enzyme